jgi:hypothetical protein
VESPLFGEIRVSDHLISLKLGRLSLLRSGSIKASTSVHQECFRTTHSSNTSLFVFRLRGDPRAVQLDIPMPIGWVCSPTEPTEHLACFYTGKNRLLKDKHGRYPFILPPVLFIADGSYCGSESCVGPTFVANTQTINVSKP